jgi:hypothetical protein
MMPIGFGPITMAYLGSGLGVGMLDAQGMAQHNQLIPLGFAPFNLYWAYAIAPGGGFIGWPFSSNRMRTNIF